MPIERAVVYTGVVGGGKEQSLSKQALKKVGESLEAMGVPLEHRAFPGPWAYREIFETLMKDLQAERDQEVVFNLTGGPKSMTVAATMACLMLGVRVVYVPEELEGPGKAVELPLLRARYSSILTPTQGRILKSIRDRPPASLDALSKQLRRKNATVSFHIENLERLGVVWLERNEDRRILRPRLTEAGEIVLAVDEALEIQHE